MSLSSLNKVQSSQSTMHSMQKICDSKHIPPIVIIALGALVALIAIFLALAAHQVLPQTINPISVLGEGGKIFTYCMIATGICAISGGFFWLFLKSQFSGNKDSFTSSNSAPRGNRKIHNLDKRNAANVMTASDTHQTSNRESKFNRQPCRHEGNSCYVNTTLQILAHIPGFHSLFNQQLHMPKKGLNETEDAFQKRLKVQEKGKQLIDGILKGERVKGVRDFILSLNEVCGAKGKNIYESNSGGGDARALIHSVLTCLFGQNPHACIQHFSALQSQNVFEIRQKLKGKAAPPILSFHNDQFDQVGGIPYMPEIEIPGIGNYRLEAVMFSSGKLHSAQAGHAVPIIRIENGTFVQLDDMTDKAEEISEEAITQILNGRGWQMAYYALR